MICANVVLILGLFTTHPGYDTDDFNNNNNLVGVGCGDVSLVHFNNSYNNESWGISLDRPILRLPFNSELGASLSLSTGYSEVFDLTTPVLPVIVVYQDVGPFRINLIPGGNVIDAIHVMVRWRF